MYQQLLDLLQWPLQSPEDDFIKKKNLFLEAFDVCTKCCWPQKKNSRDISSSGQVFLAKTTKYCICCGLCLFGIYYKAFVSTANLSCEYLTRIWPIVFPLEVRVKIMGEHLSCKSTPSRWMTPWSSAGCRAGPRSLHLIGSYWQQRRKQQLNISGAGGEWVRNQFKCQNSILQGNHHQSLSRSTRGFIDETS